MSFHSLRLPWLTPVKAYGLTVSGVIWSDGASLINRWPCIKVSEEVPELPQAGAPIICFAERYGGAGLGTNGGGVRCLNDHDTQFKGIGANLLAGAYTDRWHRHGALSMQDAVREVIWGELFEAALPFGAVRAKAIASTGTSYAVEVGKDKQPGLAPRGLLARELVVRPAHFMRSIFWEPGDTARHLPSDTERTRAACLASHSVLRTELGHRPWTRAPADVESPTWAECWQEVWRRAAHQLAASRVKRLVHGSLTPSNYGVDGRWLDFSTCTALSDHGRAIVAPGGVDVWRQEGMILEAMADLGYYLVKYLPASDSEQLEVHRWHSIFEAELLERTKCEFALRSGVPETWLARLDHVIVKRFVDAAVKVGLDGVRQPFLYFGGSEDAMPSRSGRHDLAGALTALAWRTPEELASAEELGQHVECPALAHELQQAYRAMRDRVADLAGAQTSVASVALAANTVRVNLPLNGLWRFPLDVTTDRVVREHPHEIGAYIGSVTGVWRPILQRLDQSPVSTKGWLTTEDWTLQEDLTLKTSDGRSITSHDLAALASTFIQSNERARMKSFAERAAGHG